MTDLVVAAGTTLHIDASFAVAPHYDLFKMGANSILRADVDLTIRATKAEFEANCLIDARGASGIAGAPGSAGFAQQAGRPGASGTPGQRGSHVTIEAALARVGGLMVITDGGGGGPGGNGGNGGDSTTFGQLAGQGGPAGQGGGGGPAGQITLRWMRASPGLPKTQNTVPNGHMYRSDGGAGGPGGAGGIGGRMLWGGGMSPNGPMGMPGTAGQAQIPSVTWQVDPTSLLWAQAQDIGPAPRSGHSMVFDPERNRLVLFGGRGPSDVFDDTWEWDGKLWTQVADTGPAGRSYHGSTFDPVSRQVMVFGGSQPQANGDLYLSDTWSWDGNGWVQVEDSGPSARRAMAIAADSVRNRVVLFSGGEVDQARNVAADDTWEWNGSSWTQVQDTGPEARLGAAMAYDSSSSNLVLFGGAADELLSDTWSWDGLNWTQVADTGPSARMGHAMTSLSSGSILFGGLLGQGGALSDTWLWTAGAWRLVQDMGPSPRYGFALATFGGGGDELPTLFGGEGGGEIYQDTWCFKERN